MGESTRRDRARWAGAAGAALLAAGLLTSCAHGAGADPAGATEAAAPTASPAATPPASTAAVTPTPSPIVASPDPASVATPTPTPAADGRAAVVPFITTATPSADAVDVAAIVPGVVESGGTCTLTAVLAGTTRTGTGHAVAAGSYTGCEAIHLAGLTAGTWQVRVSYASPTAAGASKAQSVPVG